MTPRERFSVKPRNASEGFTGEDGSAFGYAIHIPHQANRGVA